MNGIEWQHEVDVAESEFLRLLGFPRGRAPGTAVVLRMEETRNWFARNGRPWTFVCRAERLELAAEEVRIDGVPFRSGVLAGRLGRVGARGLVVAAVCAGPEAETEARRRWQKGLLDEYLFLETYAAGVVERLRERIGARLCAEVEGQGLSVFPHYSPGYAGWDLADQVPLVRLLQQRAHPSGLPLEVLASGQLVPKKAQLAVFGLAPWSKDLDGLAARVPCEDCGYHPCGFRWVPQRRRSEMMAPEGANGDNASVRF